MDSLTLTERIHDLNWYDDEDYDSAENFSDDDSTPLCKEEEFYEACAKGNESFVASTLRTRSLSSHHLAKGLYFAIANKQDRICRRLVKMGGHIFPCTFSLACRKKNSNVMKWLLAKAKGDVMFFLRIAARHGLSDVVNKLIKHPHIHPEHGLRTACLYGCVELAKHMIYHGVKAFDRGLVTAATMGHFQIVELMLHNGANLIDEALTRACANGNTAVVMLLLEFQKWSVEDLNVCFQLASDYGHCDSVEILLQHGASERKTWDLWWHVCTQGRDEFFERMLGHAKEQRGWLDDGLKAAVDGKQHHLVLQLIRAGATNIQEHCICTLHKNLLLYLLCNGIQWDQLSRVHGISSLGLKFWKLIVTCPFPSFLHSPLLYTMLSTCMSCKSQHIM